MRRTKLFAAIRDTDEGAFTAAISGARTVPNASGITALQWASFKGNTAQVEALLQKGARINESTPFGTALTAALRGGQKKTALMLLKRGAVSAPAGERGITDLMLAAANDLPEALSKLGTAKTISETDYLGENALFYAARTGPACIKPLIKMGALVSSANLHGSTPLMEAVAANNLASVTALLSAGARADVRNSEGCNALHIAARRGASGPIVKAILEHGGASAAIRRDQTGATPLSLAIRHGYLETAAELRQAPFMPPAASVAGNGSSPQKALSLALATVQNSTRAFYNAADKGCTSCHHQGLALAVLASAPASSVDSSLVNKLKSAAQQSAHSDTVAAQAAVQNPALADVPVGADTGDLPARVGSMLLGLSAAHAHHTLELSNQALAASLFQSPDGSWPANGLQSGLSGHAYQQVLQSALAAKALAVFASTARKYRTEERLARAQEWFLSLHLEDCEGRAARLLGLKWSGASREDCAVAAYELLEAQKADGGWPAIAGTNRESDTRVTALALYALSEAGGMSSNSRAIAMAIRFLTTTQQDDGSWFTPPHRLPVCPAIDAGFAHGAAQVSSFETTCWAALALIKAGIH
jgi:ankyrin repeat protein